jgi:pimeloyl-ACP methyl ester carboxylesterase
MAPGILDWSAFKTQAQRAQPVDQESGYHESRRVNKRNGGMIDCGTGPAVVLVPGIQGRWEWMRPTVAALSRGCRVLSFSLCGEPGTRIPAAPGPGLTRYVTQLDDLLDRVGLERIVLCGVSFGGLIAVHYAAQRLDRIAGLVLVSSPGPSWRPDRRIERYLRAPRLMALAFVAGSPARMWPEIVAAYPAWGPRLGFTARHLVRVLRAPMSPTLMAERVRAMVDADIPGDCRAIDRPTLVMTGEAALDRVVPTTSSQEYLSAIRNARGTTLRRTGHIGLVTRPDAFADIVLVFVARLADHSGGRSSAVR